MDVLLLLVQVVHRDLIKFLIQLSAAAAAVVEMVAVAVALEDLEKVNVHLILIQLVH